MFSMYVTPSFAPRDSALDLNINSVGLDYSSVGPNCKALRLNSCQGSECSNGSELASFHQDICTHSYHKCSQKRI